MPETWIETPEQLEHALHYWKNYTFSDSYINLQDAVDTIKTGDRFIQASRVYASRWILNLKDSKGVEEAIFHTAGIYRWGTNDETGNFVLPGMQAESGVPESRIRTEPSTLCQFSYGIDTHRDKTIWRAQKSFEEYVVGVEGFNKAQKKRRAWQDGTAAENPNSMFVFNSQVFVKRNAATKHREAHIPYELHNWIKAVTVDSPRSEYFANPDRPSLLEPRQGELCSIKGSSPPVMQKGDLVWISFSVQFIIGSDAWSTTFVPYEIVRVGTVAPHLVGEPDRVAAVVETAVPRGRLQVGMKIDMHEDFPMHLDATGSGPSSMAQGVCAQISEATSSSTTTMPSEEVYFGPQDEQKCAWQRHNYDRRSASPITWTPSPPANDTEGDTSIDTAATPSRDSPISPAYLQGSPSPAHNLGLPSHEPTPRTTYALLPATESTPGGAEIPERPNVEAFNIVLGPPGSVATTKSVGLASLAVTSGITPALIQSVSAIPASPVKRSRVMHPSLTQPTDTTSPVAHSGNMFPHSSPTPMGVPPSAAPLQPAGPVLEVALGAAPSHASIDSLPGPSSVLSPTSDPARLKISIKVPPAGTAAMDAKVESTDMDDRKGKKRAADDTLPSTSLPETQTRRASARVARRRMV